MSEDEHALGKAIFGMYTAFRNSFHLDDLSVNSMIKLQGKVPRIKFMLRAAAELTVWQQ